MRAYIPDVIQSRLDAGQTEWLAEFRRLTVLFVNLIGIDYEAPDALERVQQITHAMQNVLSRYEGNLHKLIVDDKGTVLLSAFGLPPMAHEDDAARGVQAALEIQDKLSQLGLRSTIGITTGRVFCGPVGSDVRREYAVIGDTVNVAARLMQVERREIPHSGAAGDGILCDAATAQRRRIR